MLADDSATGAGAAGRTQLVGPRPSMRGVFHRASALIAVGLTVVAALRASTGGELAAVVVYGVCLTAMFATSGIYHAPRFATAASRRLLRRLDHSMILVGISGTYTAVIVLSLDGATRVVLLAVVWALAAVGVACRMAWLDAPPALVALVYLGAGWQLLLDMPAYLDGTTGGQVALLATGGGLYTVGAILFALRRPDPWPAVFGYHEVWHTLVVAAAFLHWLTVYSLLG